MQSHELYSQWNFPGQIIGVVSLLLLQGIFPTQRSNPSLLHCRQILFQLSHRENSMLFLQSRTTLHYLFFFFLIYYLLEYSDLQHCVSFCYKANRISYTYIHSFSDSILINVITVYWIEFPVLYRRFLLSLFYMLLLLSPSVVLGSVWPYGLWCSRILYPWNSPGKNTREGCHALLQGIFPNPGIKPGFPSLQADSLLLSH